MNLISFSNFNISENQPSLLPSAEKDGKPEDFSALLNNIFVALQTANVPSTNFSSGFEQNGLQVQTVSDGGQNLVLGNNQSLPQNLFNQIPVLPANTENPASIKTNINQNILQNSANSGETLSIPIPQNDSPVSFSSAENLLSIPENFQPVPKLPTMQNVLTENRAKQNSTDIPQFFQPNTQSANNIQSADAPLPFSSKDFEILSEPETNNFLPRPAYSFAAPMKAEPTVKPLQIFKNISNSIRETDLPKTANVKIEPVLPTNDRAETVVIETPVSKTETPILNSAPSIEAVNPKIEEIAATPIVVSSEKPEQITKPTISASEKPANEPTALPSLSVETSEKNPIDLSSIPNLPESSEIKLPIISEATPKMESPINSESNQKLNPVLENTVKVEISQTQDKVSEVSVNEPQLATKTQEVLTAKPAATSEILDETKPQVEVKAKSTTAPVPTFKTEKVAENQSNDVSLPTESQNDVSLPIEPKVELKTDVVTQPQINLNSPKRSIFEEMFPNDPVHLQRSEETLKPSTPNFSVKEIKPETTLPQPISLNLDPQIVESVEVKPQAEIPLIKENVQPKVENVVISKPENTVPNEIIQPRLETSIPSETIQPKIPNTLIDETFKPTPAETPKLDFVNEPIKPISVNETANPILSGGNLSNFSLPVENTPAPVSFTDKTLPVADKNDQPEMLKSSIEETLKTNLVENNAAEVRPEVNTPSILQNLMGEVNSTEVKTAKPKANSHLIDAEAAENTPLQVNAQPENQRSNQTQTVVSNETIQTENTLKVSGSETSQNFSFSEKPKAEIKSKEVENNLPVSFDKVIENAVKDTKIVETNTKPQIDPAKIAEQINPRLLEMAGLVEKKHEKEILKLRLHPAELGTVEITLEKNSSGVLNAHFKTETTEAQQALSKGLEQLRDTLQNNGWNIGQMDISNGSNSSTDHQNRQNNQQKSEWIENFAFNRSSEQPDETESNSPARLLNLQA